MSGTQVTSDQVSTNPQHVRNVLDSNEPTPCGPVLINRTAVQQERQTSSIAFGSVTSTQTAQQINPSREVCNIYNTQIHNDSKNMLQTTVTRVDGNLVYRYAARTDNGIISYYYYPGRNPSVHAKVAQYNQHEFDKYNKCNGETLDQGEPVDYTSTIKMSEKFNKLPGDLTVTYEPVAGVRCKVYTKTTTGGKQIKFYQQNYSNIPEINERNARTLAELNGAVAQQKKASETIPSADQQAKKMRDAYYEGSKESDETGPITRYDVSKKVEAENMAQISEAAESVPESEPDAVPEQTTEPTAEEQPASEAAPDQAAAKGGTPASEKADSTAEAVPEVTEPASTEGVTEEQPAPAEVTPAPSEDPKAEVTAGTAEATKPAAAAAGAAPATTKPEAEKAKEGGFAKKLTTKTLKGVVSAAMGPGAVVIDEAERMAKKWAERKTSTTPQPAEAANPAAEATAAGATQATQQPAATEQAAATQPAQATPEANPAATATGAAQATPQPTPTGPTPVPTPQPTPGPAPAEKAAAAATEEEIAKARYEHYMKEFGKPIIVQAFMSSPHEEKFDTGDMPTQEEFDYAVDTLHIIPENVPLYAAVNSGTPGSVIHDVQPLVSSAEAYNALSQKEKEAINKKREERRPMIQQLQDQNYQEDVKKTKPSLLGGRRSLISKPKYQRFESTKKD